MRTLFLRFIAPAFICVGAVSSSVFGNHGPGASGGGSSTNSGETLPVGKFALSLREDYTQFEHFSQAAAAANAAVTGDFDALDHGFLTSAEVAYGVTDDLQVGVGIGFFHGMNFVGVEDDGGGAEIGTVNPTGFTDMSVTLKYRVLKGRPGNLALIGGAVLPTGRTDVLLSNGERLSPTDQPGTGRYGMPLGVAYSRYLTSRVTLDASVIYTVRFEKDLFKVGDRIDTGVAVAYRLTDSINVFPQFSVFAELNDVHIFKDYVDGAHDGNSGGNTLFLTPGFRVRFDQRASLSIAPSVPVWHHANGVQGDVHFKVSVTFAYAF